MKKSVNYSRRRFLTLGSLSLAGLWAGCSNQAGARVVRELISDARRSIAQPEYCPDPASWNPEAITASWLGHSTVLINFYGVTILTDPALFDRVGAQTFAGTVGAKRLVAAALPPSKLPKIDLVLVSHAHMDHLDFPTMESLRGSPQVVTAHATLDLFKRLPVSKPVALAWNETTRVRTAHGEVRVRAFEVKHWGARWRYDKHRGYNGYVLSREGKQIIFGGDTAWTESFRGLRQSGPYEAAIMPIGAYEPWIHAHCTPEEALRMADAADAAKFLPIHHKTFRFGREGALQPLARLEAAIDPERIGWRHVGQTCMMA